MISMTRHATERCIERDIDPRRVVDAVNRVEHKIDACSTPEIRVIVHEFEAVVRCPDGSHGDLVIACIDPARRKIKTVMYRNAEQIGKESGREIAYVKGV